MSRRIERVNELLRQELGQLIMLDLRDPRTGGMISVTAVVTSPDLRNAQVYVSVLGGEPEQEAAVAALRQAAGYLRRQLLGRVELRHVPELDFRLDRSIESGRRIDELLAEIAPPPEKPRRRRTT
jgi:ribosome-binding factor A